MLLGQLQLPFELPFGAPLALGWARAEDDSLGAHDARSACPVSSSEPLQPGPCSVSEYHACTVDLNNSQFPQSLQASSGAAAPAPAAAAPPPAQQDRQAGGAAAATSAQSLLGVGHRIWGSVWDGRGLLQVKIFDLAIYADVDSFVQNTLSEADASTPQRKRRLPRLRRRKRRASESGDTAADEQQQAPASGPGAQQPLDAGRGGQLVTMHPDLTGSLGLTSLSTAPGGGAPLAALFGEGGLLAWWQPPCWWPAGDDSGGGMGLTGMEGQGMRLRAPEQLLVSDARVGVSVVLRAARPLPLTVLQTEYEKSLKRRLSKIGGDPSDPALAGLIAALAPSNFPPEVIMPSKQQQQQQQQRQGTGGGRCDLLQTATPLEVGQAPPASAAAPGSEEGGSSSGGRGLRGSKGGSKGSGKPDYVAQLESGSGSIRPGALLTFERQLGGCLTARVGQQVLGTFCSPKLAEALLDCYLGQQPVSRGAKMAARQALNKHLSQQAAAGRQAGGGEGRGKG